MSAPWRARPRVFRGTWREDPDARAVYSEAAGIARVLPRAVAVPADADDVAALVRWAHGRRVPLVPRGSGSSMSGGAVGDGVIVDLSRLDAIGEVDTVRGRVWAGPGAIRNAVDRAAAAHGLRFPPDPSSGGFCTVGGMVSTNAAGARSLKYGATRAWVTAIDCVFDDGTRAIVRRGAPPPSAPAIARFLGEGSWLIDGTLAPLAALRRAGVRKESSGYALAQYAESGELLELLVGSEGTLALFVGVELALAPRPGATASVLAAFQSLEQAVSGAAAAREAGASACELLERTFLDVARTGGCAPELPESTEAVLLIETEGSGAAAAGDAARAIARQLGAAGAAEVALALDAAAERTMWELRHAASPILSRLDPALKSMQFIEDGAVPPERLPDYVRGVRRVLEARGVRGVIFGHAGDAHVHVNPLVDLRRPDWREVVRGALEDVTALTSRLGGTMAGEHGDGRLRAPLVERVWGYQVAQLFALVKEAFDPLGILNAGVKLPLPGQEPIGDVKYDPSLPPLPSAARRALDRIERERAYARFRLDLLTEAESGPAEGTHGVIVE